jgi:hypothetical protein
MNVNGEGAAMSGLTDQIRHTINNPLTSTEFDFIAVLDGSLVVPGSRRSLPARRDGLVDGANPLVRWVGLSGLEPLTSALSGRFRPPEHANRRQRVAVNSRADKAQR